MAKEKKDLKSETISTLFIKDITDSGEGSGEYFLTSAGPEPVKESGEAQPSPPSAAHKTLPDKTAASQKMQSSRNKKSGEEIKPLIQSPQRPPIGDNITSNNTKPAIPQPVVVANEKEPPAKGRALEASKKGNLEETLKYASIAKETITLAETYRGGFREQHPKQVNKTLTGFDFNVSFLEEYSTTVMQTLGKNITESEIRGAYYKTAIHQLTKNIFTDYFVAALQVYEQSNKKSSLFSSLFRKKSFIPLDKVIIQMRGTVPTNIGKDKYGDFFFGVFDGMNDAARSFQKIVAQRPHKKPEIVVELYSKDMSILKSNRQTLIDVKEQNKEYIIAVRQCVPTKNVADWPSVYVDDMVRDIDSVITALLPELTKNDGGMFYIQLKKKMEYPLIALLLEKLDTIAERMKQESKRVSQTVTSFHNAGYTISWIVDSDDLAQEVEARIEQASSEYFIPSGKKMQITESKEFGRINVVSIARYKQHAECTLLGENFSPAVTVSRFVRSETPQDAGRIYRQLYRQRAMEIGNVTLQEIIAQKPEFLILQKGRNPNQKEIFHELSNLYRDIQNNKMQRTQLYRPVIVVDEIYKKVVTLNKKQSDDAKIPMIITSEYPIAMLALTDEHLTSGSKNEYIAKCADKIAEKSHRMTDKTIYFVVYQQNTDQREIEKTCTSLQKMYTLIMNKNPKARQNVTVIIDGEGTAQLLLKYNKIEPRNRLYASSAEHFKVEGGKITRSD